MRSANLAPLILAAAGGGELGFRQGTVVSWDPDTGENTIRVGGSDLADLPVLSASAITLAPGDVVGILRYRSSWMILGSVTTSSLRIRAAHSDSATHTITADSLFHDLTADPGPSVTVTIGNSRQCVVLMAMAINAKNSEVGCGVAVSGASSIAPLNTASAGGGAFGPTDTTIVGSCSSFQVITADDGLEAGSNTFTLQYIAQNGTGGSHLFWDRRITVIPL